MGLKNAMAKAKKLWGKASKRAAEETGYTEFEDGRYAAQIVKASLNESKSSSRLQASLSYKVLEGEYKGQTIMSHDGLETEDNLMYFAKRIAAIGLEVPEDFDEVESVLKTLEKKKPKVRIRVKTKGEYQNVYVEKPISDDDIDDSEGSDEASEEDVELKKGMKVIATIDGEEVDATIVKILEDKGKVKVEDEDGETHVVKNEDIQVPEADEDEDDSDDDEDGESDDDGDGEDEDKDDDDDKDEDDDEDSDEDDSNDEDEDEEPKSKVTKKKSKLKKGKK